MSGLITSVWIVGASVVALGLLVVTLGMQRLLRLRWRRIVSHPVGISEVPEPSQRALESVAPQLRSLGFAYLHSGVTQTAVVTEPDHAVFFQVYLHAERRVYAMVSVSPVPEPQDPCVLQFITPVSDVTFWVTMNRFRHFSPMRLPGWRVFDDYLPTWQDAYQRHLARIQTIHVLPGIDSEGLLRELHQSFSDLVPAMQKAGQLQAEAEQPHLRLTWVSALRFTAIALAGQWRARWAVRHRSRTSTPADATGTDAESAALHAQWTQRQGTASSSRTKWLVFVGSALLFLAVGSLWMSWSFVPTVLAVIALHEGGHYLAMRLTGYRNVSVFFVPGLGGLAVGEKATATPLEKLLVYLAGPVPGIALAGVAFWAANHGGWTAPPWLQEFLVASLVINYLNLLPLVPLDGGRVLETLVFARLPRLRFAFAALCCALLFGIGHWLGDGVLRVVAVLLALGLPHQWRVMQLDRATPRPAGTALDEAHALQSLLAGLQAIPSHTWSFAQRSAAVITLMPELMGRKARLWESLAGLALYAAVLCAPLGLALATLPQLGIWTSIFLPVLQVPPDDVEPERAPPTPPGQTPVDWQARLSLAASLPEADRLPLLLGAGKDAADSEDTDTALRHFKAAWAIAKNLPPRDMQRIDALEGLANVVESDAERQGLLQQIVDALSEPQGDERSRVAYAKEQLAYGDIKPAMQVTLLRDAVQLRTTMGPAHAPLLLDARRMLAHALERQADALGAEVQLRTRIDALTLPDPSDRSREALNRRVQRVSSLVDWGWFLMAHQRHAEAQQAAAEALAGLPHQITMSWVNPQQQALEAAVWAELSAPAPTALRSLWDAYDASRRSGFGAGRPVLVHEVDRAVVAQALQDKRLQAQAQRGMAEARASITRRPPLCDAPISLLHNAWRAHQHEARRRALQTSGACGP
ncbi:MAG: hypothetical protein CFE44_04990 [Burkholderiales bacterium PBB4]|nr:MAG: hypothetical protein CFE44_04990 [Burkholderiales bacterium PBB4]